MVLVLYFHTNGLLSDFYSAFHKESSFTASEIPVESSHRRHSDQLFHFLRNKSLNMGLNGLSTTKIKYRI
jgi:hypothetical protein